MMLCTVVTRYCRQNISEQVDTMVLGSWLVGSGVVSREHGVMISSMGEIKIGGFSDYHINTFHTAESNFNAIT
jgi:hypothetical protein